MAEPLKKVAQGAALVLIDEAGAMLAPLARRGLARRGKTPVLRHRGRHREKVSLVAALVWAAALPGLGLRFRSYPRAYVNNAKAADFLRGLLAEVAGEVVVRWDGSTNHKGEPIRQLLAQEPRLSLVRLPAYIPKFNPVEYLWSWLKYGQLPNFAALDAAMLDEAVRQRLALAQNNPRCCARSRTIASYQTPAPDFLNVDNPNPTRLPLGEPPIFILALSDVHLQMLRALHSAVRILDVGETLTVVGGLGRFFKGRSTARRRRGRADREAALQAVLAFPRSSQRPWDNLALRRERPPGLPVALLPPTDRPRAGTYHRLQRRAHCPFLARVLSFLPIRILRPTLATLRLVFSKPPRRWSHRCTTPAPCSSGSSATSAPSTNSGSPPCCTGSASVASALAARDGQAVLLTAGRLPPAPIMDWIEDNAAEVVAILTRYNVDFTRCVAARDGLPHSLRGPIEKAHEAHSLANLSLPALTELFTATRHLPLASLLNP